MATTVSEREEIIRLRRHAQLARQEAELLSRNASEVARRLADVAEALEREASTREAMLEATSHSTH